MNNLTPKTKPPVPTDSTLYKRIAALSDSQRAALAQALSTQPAQRLVAYVVPQAADNFNLATIQALLRAKLPAHMVPTAIVLLDVLPRLANGKIDTRSLPTPQPVATCTHTTATPRTPTEQTLAQIWSTVLGISTVGIHDNFFELGGDSILSIQIVSLAREANLRLAPNQLFEHPTLAKLAAAVDETLAEVPSAIATQSPVTGPVPLTSIQHWFFSQQMVAAHHWQQAALFELPVGLDADLVQQALTTLWTHHDALRLHFKPHSEGWQQQNMPVDNPPKLSCIDLFSLSEAEQVEAVANHGTRLHTDIALETGGLIRTALFNRGTNHSSWLLISLHHLVVDAVSWQILHRDLVTLLIQHGSLPAKTTAFKTWAETLNAKASHYLSEADFWISQVETKAITFFQSGSTPATEETANTITTSLDTSNTQALLQSVPAAYNTQINDILLAALGQAWLQWTNSTAGNVRIEVEGHGREAIAPEIDLSRTVGWFTTTYPVTLQITDADNCEKTLKAVKEQLRQIPNRGIGYGILRYLIGETIQAQLAKAPGSEILFNYLGRQDIEQKALETENSETHTIRLLRDISLGTLRSGKNSRSYPLEINAWVTNGQLAIHWTYDAQRFKASEITRLAHGYLSALKTLITHCNCVVQSVVQGGFTPSDFPDAQFDQNELDDFINQITAGGLSDG